MPAVDSAHPISDDLSPVTLRGTSRGLEIVINDSIQLKELTTSIDSKLKQSPEFFAGGDVVLRFAEEPPRGCLGPIEDITSNYDLRIVGVRTGNTDDEGEDADAKEKIGKYRATSYPKGHSSEASPSKHEKNEHLTGKKSQASPHQQSGQQSGFSRIWNRNRDKSGDIEAKWSNQDSTFKTNARSESTRSSADLLAAEARLNPTLNHNQNQSQVPTASVNSAEGLQHTLPNTTTIAGPIRSGSTVTAPGNLVVVGDVNPGAELHANGSILVLGSLRGIAHAGYETPSAMILAMKLQPQQLRIGNLIARAGDSDHPGRGAEIAYADQGRIIVESYQGRVPFGIAASIF